jgi:hypothetical protein
MPPALWVPATPPEPLAGLGMPSCGCFLWVVFDCSKEHHGATTSYVTWWVNLLTHPWGPGKSRLLRKESPHAAPGSMWTTFYSMVLHRMTSGRP